MKATVAVATDERHRLLPEKSHGQLRTDLRKAEAVDFKAEIGRCLWRAALMCGWDDLEVLAGKLPAPDGSEKRDPRQVARWISGQERVQLDVVWAVTELRQPMAYQLAKLSNARPSLLVEFEEAV